MSSNIIQRFAITVAGQPIAFAQPFAAPNLDLEEAPAQFVVQIPASGTASLWAGAPLPDDFDVFLITSDQSLDVEFTLSGGDMFTLFVRAGGFPTTLQGSDSYSGGLSGTLETIASVQAKNRNTEEVANVSLLIGKAAA